MTPHVTRELLGEQLAYYRIGSREYEEANRDLLARTGEDGESRRLGYGHALALLNEVALGHDVLELAGGTGIYTRHLCMNASRLLVVDASPESLDISRAATARANIDVEYVLSDIFKWVPPRRFEVVVFAFWMSHVPHERFDGFWELVDRALAPGGTVAIIDARAPAQQPDPSAVVRNFFSEKRIDDQISVRSLADGRQFRIVRIMWSPDALRTRLADLGWHAEINESSPWLVAAVRRTSEL